MSSSPDRLWSDLGTSPKSLQSSRWIWSPEGIWTNIRVYLKYTLYFCNNLFDRLPAFVITRRDLLVSNFYLFENARLPDLPQVPCIGLDEGPAWCLQRLHRRLLQLHGQLFPKLSDQGRIFKVEEDVGKLKLHAILQHSDNSEPVLVRPAPNLWEKLSKIFDGWGTSFRQILSKGFCCRQIWEENLKSKISSL